MRNNANLCGKLFAPMLAAAVVLIATPAAIQAGMMTIPVLNASFGSLNVLDNGTSTTPTSWTSSGGGLYDPVNAQFLGTTGDNANTMGKLPPGAGQVGIITTYISPSPGVLGGSLTQTVGTVTADTSYTLTVAIGKRLDTPIGVWTIELLAGATVIASNTGDGTGITAGTFVDKSAVSPFTGEGSDPNVGQTLIIKILGSNVSGNTATAQDQFDNVRLTSIPEPASVIFLAAGALLLLRRRFASQL